MTNNNNTQCISSNINNNKNCCNYDDHIVCKHALRDSQQLYTLIKNCRNITFAPLNTIHTQNCLYAD